MITAKATIKPRRSKKAQLNARGNGEHTLQWTHIVIKCSQWGSMAWTHTPALRRKGHVFQKSLAVSENEAKPAEPHLANKASHEVSHTHTLALWAWHSMLKEDDKLSAEDQPMICVWGMERWIEGMREQRWNPRGKKKTRYQESSIPTLNTRTTAC